MSCTNYLSGLRHALIMSRSAEICSRTHSIFSWLCSFWRINNATCFYLTFIFIPFYFKCLVGHLDLTVLELYPLHTYIQDGVYINKNHSLVFYPPNVAKQIFTNDFSVFIFWLLVKQIQKVIAIPNKMPALLSASTTFYYLHWRGSF